ncbi:hypothetical protein CEXT_346571 [Caerostris extrusa]|uniref:Uncharacterized protein n=1 Tax=Caerostris extrusa TaxID=172846 RepID=A0AAV4NZY9_CAEEX|nr:hypothetical protein CEXT_346571 [Caerostris extrusa]
MHQSLELWNRFPSGVIECSARMFRRGVGTLGAEGGWRFDGQRLQNKSWVMYHSSQPMMKVKNVLLLLPSDLCLGLSRNFGTDFLVELSNVLQGCSEGWWGGGGGEYCGVFGCRLSSRMRMC